MPLGPKALRVLREEEVLSAGSDLIFPGAIPVGAPFKHGFTMILRRMRMDTQATAHGFRSTFSRLGQ